ncbi:hypothetical protein QJQ45_007358 [Haematococcus lacustris]|nr:hypothetical protein QJQ45_007358 [Haematococcus lacustris]
MTTHDDGISEALLDRVADNARGQKAPATEQGYDVQRRKIQALCKENNQDSTGCWDPEKITVPTAVGILDQLRINYEAGRGVGQGMGVSTLKKFHAALNIMFRQNKLREGDNSLDTNLNQHLAYQTAYQNLLFKINGSGKRAVLTCMWAGIARSDDIRQLRLQDLRRPNLLPTVGPLTCHAFGFLFIGGKTGTPNGSRYITFTRAANVTVCPVNAIGSFLWHKYSNTRWDMPLPDAKEDPNTSPWLTEAFFCVEKTTRTTAACWAYMASYYSRLKKQFKIISDKLLHAFRKGAAFNLFNQGAQSDLIRSVGNWKNDVMMQAYTTGAAPQILIQQGGWRHIDNDYLRGYFSERFLIKVPEQAVHSFYPFLAGLQAAASKMPADSVSGPYVAEAIFMYGEAVIQDFIHQAAEDSLAGKLDSSRWTPVELCIWGLPHVHQLVVQHREDLKNKVFEHLRPKDTKEELAESRAENKAATAENKAAIQELRACQFTMMQMQLAAAGSSPHAMGNSLAVLASAGLISKLAAGLPHPSLGASLAAALAHPAQPPAQHPAQPPALQPSLAAALAPPAQPPALQPSLAAALAPPAQPPALSNWLAAGLPYPAQPPALQPSLAAALAPPAQPPALQPSLAAALAPPAQPPALSNWLAAGLPYPAQPPALQPSLAAALAPPAQPPALQPSLAAALAPPAQPPALQPSLAAALAPPAQPPALSNWLAAGLPYPAHPPALQPSLAAALAPPAQPPALQPSLAAALAPPAQLPALQPSLAAALAPPAQPPALSNWLAAGLPYPAQPPALQPSLAAALAPPAQPPPLQPSLAAALAPPAQPPALSNWLAAGLPYPAQPPALQPSLAAALAPPAQPPALQPSLAAALAPPAQPPALQPSLAAALAPPAQPPALSNWLAAGLPYPAHPPALQPSLAAALAPPAQPPALQPSLAAALAPPAQPPALQPSLAAALAPPAQPPALSNWLAAGLPYPAQPPALQPSLAAALAPPAQPPALSNWLAAGLPYPTQPPAQPPALQPSLAAALAPPAQPPAQLPAPSKMSKGHYMRTLSCFEDIESEYEYGLPGVRPPLKALEAEQGRPHRGGDKNYSDQVEYLKDCVFTIKMVRELEGLTAKELQQLADKDFRTAASQSQGSNKVRFHRRWSGLRKWLQDKFPKHYQAAREMKKKPGMTSAEAMALMDRPVESVPTPLRLLKRGRQEQGLHSPNAQSAKRILFGELQCEELGLDVAACADTLITQLQQQAGAVCGSSQGQAYKQVVGGVQEGVLVQLAAALSLPISTSKGGQQGMCGYALYGAMKRAGMEAQHPGVEAAQITKLLASAWACGGGAIQGVYNMYAAIANKLEGRK